ncbi:MAG: agmatinase [Pseudodesulfovibrio sp.]|uniref:Agmatinase n=1 Tax=Pseudodesulfovibrio aespoeensis (strain ATCC 700646 / DSM 10631 / Aspo-2) TaxID=643562 RepID=E6VRX5_PSEA9|nr:MULTISPECIES: agmatinase [Pseudodesulfovibrio]MBU4192759.1 agmatinase [Pseudomonadota bacterium]ADU61908.1 agmatinase [Pseudodesulfovibrio aespoeensis Aspo-2]MBU4243634.1 agmatinase [Pseudomonadota bacterium]MBU4377724.1 agmatinase [Pseudomonadota bacterium]MBU4475730.1 agmatinase [Pseudomonadota bacterium]
MAPHFLEGEIPNEKPDKAAVHIIPVPLETSTSYGAGTAAGPAAIIEASKQLELWNGSWVPASGGVHTADPVDCSKEIAKTLDRIEDAVAYALECEALPLVLGGEHTVTLGALRAMKLKYGRFGVVQFDAHADLRNTYQGSPYSHACVMRRAMDDLRVPVFQVGVRAMCAEEADYRKAQAVPCLDARKMHLKGIPTQLLPADFPERIYITFDVDGLDPSVIRATGTPVPGGLGWHDALTLLERTVAGRHVIGADVVELAPAQGDHASDFAAALLAYCLMGLSLPRE